MEKKGQQVNYTVINLNWIFPVILTWWHNYHRKTEMNVIMLRQHFGCWSHQFPLPKHYAHFLCSMQSTRLWNSGAPPSDESQNNLTSVSQAVCCSGKAEPAECEGAALPSSDAHIAPDHKRLCEASSPALAHTVSAMSVMTDCGWLLDSGVSSVHHRFCGL